MRSLYIVDINSLMFRAYYGIKHNLTTADGQPIKAVYGVVKMLNSIIKKNHPTEMVIAYDSQTQLLRKQFYHEYKANRHETPDDLKSQFPILKKFVQISQLQSFEEDGYEADDLIGSLACHYQDQFDQIAIVTGDKDLMQLVNETVVIYDGMKQKIYDVDGVYEKFGVYPNQIKDYLSMVGDTSDNVPGVKGIGAKGASALLKQFGTLEGIYRNVALVKGKKKDNLIEGEQNAFLSQKLISLAMDLPITINHFMNGGIDLYTNDLLNFYFQHNLKSIIGNRQFELQAESKQDKSFQKLSENFKQLENLSELPNFFKNCEQISCYFEEEEQELLGISLSKSDETLYCPGECPELMSHLKPYFESDQITKICHGSKHLMHLLKKHNIDLKQFEDTRVASYVIDATAHNHSLENSLKSYLTDHFTTFAEAVAGSGSKSLRQVPAGERFHFIAERGALIWHLWETMKKRLKEGDLEQVYREIDLPMVSVLADMERCGITLDTEHLKELGTVFNKRRKTLEDQIFELAGEKFNLNSPKQLGVVLFEKLELPVIKRTQTGYATGEEVLQKLTSYSPIPELVLQYRSLTKLVTTYLDSLLGLVKNGRIYTTFNHTVTATGRLSSSNPNLQNIPIKTAEGRQIRGSFMAAQGKKLVMLDYSQVELRILAHLSQAPSFLEAFQQKQDIHSRTAAEIFDIPIESVPAAGRRVAKTINFGLIYGMGSHKLAQELNIPVKKANEYILKYFERYERVKSFKEEVLEKVRETEEIRTLFNRIRHFPEINSRNLNLRKHTERMAFNTLIQGTAADLMKKVMIQMALELPKCPYNVDMILQVHDELIFEVDEQHAATFIEFARNIMEQEVKLSVPLKVDGNFGDRWEK